MLQFWDLGGQREIRGLWDKYYNESSAVCFIIDSTATERLEECWTVFGPSLIPSRHLRQNKGINILRFTETVLADRRVKGVPVLVLANKQDAEGSIPVEEIKQMFNKLIEGKLNVSEGAVMPISALNGSVDRTLHATSLLIEL